MEYAIVWLAGPFIGLGPQLNTWAECCRCSTLILLLFQLHLLSERIVQKNKGYFFAKHYYFCLTFIVY